MYIISNNAVAQQEDKGRTTYLSIFTGMTWTNNQDKYGVWDLSGSTTTTQMYTEIKAREIKSNDFNTTFLEEKKYHHLMDLANISSKGKPFYFVTFSDRVGYLFDLKVLGNIEKYKTKRWMKEVSLEGQTLQVQKEVYELPLYDKIKGITKYRWA